MHDMAEKQRQLEEKLQQQIAETNAMARRQAKEVQERKCARVSRLRVLTVLVRLCHFVSAL